MNDVSHSSRVCSSINSIPNERQRIAARAIATNSGRMGITMRLERMERSGSVWK